MVKIWSMIGRLAGIGAPLDLVGLAARPRACALRSSWRCVEFRFLLRVRPGGRPRGRRPAAQTCAGPGMAPSDVCTCGASTPQARRKAAMPSSGTTRPSRSSPSCSADCRRRRSAAAAPASRGRATSNQLAALLMRAISRSRARRCSAAFRCDVISHGPVMDGLLRSTAADAASVAADGAAIWLPFRPIVRLSM